MTVAYSSAANRDVKRALDHYKKEAGNKVANSFIDQLQNKIAMILENPESYRVVAKGLRCANLDRFPYQIVYRIDSRSVIREIAVRHNKQRPDFGLDR